MGVGVGKEAANTHCWVLRTLGGEAWALGPHSTGASPRWESGEGREGFLEKEANKQGPQDIKN